MGYLNLPDNTDEFIYSGNRKVSLTDRAGNIKCTFVPVSGFTAKFFRHINLIAIVMPWRSIYILPEWLEFRQVRRHELVHIAQIRRDGAIIQALKCIYYYIRYGYKNSPYEVEARRIGGI